MEDVKPEISELIRQKVESKFKEMDEYYKTIDMNTP